MVLGALKSTFYFANMSEKNEKERVRKVRKTAKYQRIRSGQKAEESAYNQSIPLL